MLFQRGQLPGSAPRTLSTKLSTNKRLVVVGGGKGPIPYTAGISKQSSSGPAFLHYQPCLFTVKVSPGQAPQFAVDGIQKCSGVAGAICLEYKC